MLQQQHLLPVPLSMPYGSHGNSQQQQYLYMPQQQATSVGGYSYEMNGSGHNDGGDSLHQQQSRYPSQQTYARQQQQLHQSASAPREIGQGQRGAWPPNGNGGRTDKPNGGRNDNGSSNSLNNHQQQDDFYTPLDSNGEVTARSPSSNQRPPEGTYPQIYTA